MQQLLWALDCHARNCSLQQQGMHTTTSEVSQDISAEALSLHSENISQLRRNDQWFGTPQIEHHTHHISLLPKIPVSWHSSQKVHDGHAGIVLEGNRPILSPTAWSFCSSYMQPVYPQSGEFTPICTTTNCMESASAHTHIIYIYNIVYIRHVIPFAVFKTTCSKYIHNLENPHRSAQPGIVWNPHQHTHT